MNGSMPSWIASYRFFFAIQKLKAAPLFQNQTAISDAQSCSPSAQRPATFSAEERRHERGRLKPQLVHHAFKARHAASPCKTKVAYKINSNKKRVLRQLAPSLILCRRQTPPPASALFCR
jgi:hypothetical protein